MFLRTTICTLAALAAGAATASPPAAPGGNGSSSSGPALPATNPLTARANWRVVTFRGAALHAPPGVVPLSGNTLLFGTVEIELDDEDVVLEFNDRGEACFAVAPDQPPHAFVVRIGTSKIVASGRSRLIVPNPAVGRPRFEALPNTYRVPTPREFLDQSHDLGDPLDASPFR